MIDYANYVYDDLDVLENEVEIVWENQYRGGFSLEKNKYSFEEFVERYNNDSLK